jgi:hypothetical protein
VALVVAKGAGSSDNLTNICMSAIISIEVEKSEEVFNLNKVKSGILGNDGLSEDSFFFVLNDNLPVDAHLDILTLI